MIEYLLGPTDGKVLGSDEGIKLGLSDGELVDTIPGNLHGITPVIDVVTYLNS